jgi:class 3 adenylate cyclase
VDDIRKNAEALYDVLKMVEPDWKIDLAVGVDASVKAVKEVDARLAAGSPYAVVIVDLHMNNDEQSGIKIIKEVQAIDPLAMTILYTSHPNLLDSQDTSGLGAFDVVVKGEETWRQAGCRILERTRAALRYRAWAERITYLRRYFDKRFFETVEGDRSFLQAKNRDLTMVFWDIRGFTKLCNTLREYPELVAGFLKEYYEIGAKTIFEHEGLLDKFIGDGVMALFGVVDQTDAGQEKGAIAAVQAALELHAQFDSAVKTWNQKWTKRAKEVIPSLRLGCGIHTGRALVGNLGTDYRDQFTAVGPDVNFAQRLETVAARDPGSDILISQTTYSHVKNQFKATFFKLVPNVKDFPGEYEVFRVDLSDTQRPPVTSQ